MKQFLKFTLVGIINTAIDLSVLNILVFFLNVADNKFLYIACKSISFICAVINSYFMNKIWVFNVRQKFRNERTKFIVVSALSLLINVFVSYIVFASSGHLLKAQISQTIIVNIAAIAGTISVLLSNFFGYKYLVFKVKN